MNDTSAVPTRPVRSGLDGGSLPLGLSLAACRGGDCCSCCGCCGASDSGPDMSVAASLARASRQLFRAALPGELDGPTLLRRGGLTKLDSLPAVKSPDSRRDDGGDNTCCSRPLDACVACDVPELLVRWCCVCGAALAGRLDAAPGVTAPFNVRIGVVAVGVPRSVAITGGGDNGDGCECAANRSWATGAVDADADAGRARTGDSTVGCGTV